MTQDMTRATVIILMIFLGWFTPQASAMLNPSQGRFMQRDALGYVDGMNMHQYERSRPVMQMDAYGHQSHAGPIMQCRACGGWHLGWQPCPAAPANQGPAVVAAALATDDAIHSGTLYYPYSGIGGLLAGLKATSGQITNVLGNPGAANLGTYGWITNTLTVRANVSSLTVVHELVHAQDDLILQRYRRCIS